MVSLGGVSTRSRNQLIYEPAKKTDYLVRHKTKQISIQLASFFVDKCFDSLHQQLLHTNYFYVLLNSLYTKKSSWQKQKVIVFAEKKTRYQFFALVTTID